MFKLRIVLVLLSCGLLAATSPDRPPAEGEQAEVEITDISTLQQHFREEALNLREEMYTLFREQHGSNLLALQMMNMVKEMKSVLDSVKRLEDKVDSLSKEQEDQTTTLGKMGEKVDLMRSEVRLISQYKLTWQNSSWDDTYHSDFVVDGVYTLSAGAEADNPVQHPGRGMNRKNNMIIIDLGGFFKIHTVKLWNRIDTQQSYALGVVIYADQQMIGSIHDIQRLYNFRTNDNVYGRKIFVKQTLDKYMNFIEIQVFGSGPYSEGE
jgi:hypothetical protein